MNKKCLFLVMAIGVSLSCAASKKEIQIRERILQLDSIQSTISSNQKQARIDTLLSLIDSYRELDTLLTTSITEKDSLLKECSLYTDIQFLLSIDTTVFRQNYSNDIQVPKSLEYHFQTIQMITNARNRIEIIEQKIVNITENYAQEMLKSGQVVDLKAKISSEIEGDMDEVTKLLREITNRNLSSLSPEQHSYFKPGLTDRYNNFIKFFE